MPRTLAVVGELIEQLRPMFCNPNKPPLGGVLPPVRHRGGFDVPIDILTDGEQCTGMVWVNVLRRYPVGPTFPEEANGMVLCTHSLAVVVQAGVARCVATMDDHGNPPPDDVQESEALAVLDDADRLNYALCMAGAALAEDGRALAYSLGAWDPRGPDGGIVAGTQSIIVQLGE